jgi:hypothetical protein
VCVVVVVATKNLLFVFLVLLFLFGFLLFLVLLALFFRLNRQLILDVVIFVTVQNHGQELVLSVVQRVLCQKKRGEGRQLDSYKFVILFFLGITVVVAQIFHSYG